MARDNGTFSTNMPPGETFSVDRLNEVPSDFASYIETLPGLGGGHAGKRPIAAPDSYILREPIGRGGMGIVHRAVQSTLGRYVAVKRLRREENDEPDRLGEFAFHQEAVIAARLEHPNIVPVHDFGVDDDGSPMLAMKLVRGESWLHAIVRDCQEMTPEDFLGRHVPILAQVAQAVAFAHSRGIIHRDLKPSQVMLGPYGEVLLMDWGLAMNVDEPDQRESDLEPPPPIRLPNTSSASCPAGTPSYMAPEQTDLDASNITRQTDVYLLGGVLYFLLTLTPPHHAEDAEHALELASSGVVEPAEERAPDRPIPRELAAIAAAALRPNPRERLESAEAFHRALGDYLTGTTRRREAAALLDSVADSIQSGLRDYDACGDAMSRLRRAESMWPEEPRVPRLADDIHAAWADLALGQTDLQLASLEARQVADDRGARLLERVAIETARRGKERNQRRVAIGGAFLLLVSLLGSSVLFTRTVTAERDVAQRERHTAASRAESAQDLAQFMLVDLGDALDPESKRDQDLIARITDEVMRHYRGMKTDEDSSDVRIAHAAGAVTVARELLDLGRPTEALELVEMAIAIQRAEGPDNHRVLCHYLSEQSECLSKLGRPQESLTAAQLAVEEWEVSGDPPNVEYANALNNRGGSYAALLKMPEAIADTRESVKLRTQFLGPTHPETLTTRLNDAALSMLSGRFKEAEEKLWPLLADAERDAHDSAVYLDIRRLRAALLCYQERFDEALPGMREDIIEYTRIYGPDHPSTMQSCADLANVLTARRLYAEALPYFDRIIDTTRRLYGEEAAKLPE